MNYSVYDLLGLFFIYSIAGWILETSATAVKQKQFVNRGFLNGPFCTIYGLSAVFMEVFLNELRSRVVFLFLGCAIIATLMEWIAGHFLEWLGHGKWWDYSNKKWNMDGYICLPYSVLWGVLGVISIKYLNGFLLDILSFIPDLVLKIVLLALSAVLLVDGIGSYAVIRHITKKLPTISAMNTQIDNFTNRLGMKIYQYLERRIEKAYPTVQKEPEARTKKEVFAEGCSFYKLALLFFIGAFLGDVVETIFCRMTMGVWMSRSSVVWGHFSIVWGLAIALVTLFLYNYREKSDSFLFLFGTFLGGAYEYICSVFTEIVFGKVFWDYSGIPFNLGGRINLLYSFFWGIAAVVWLKLLYPLLSGLIEKIPAKTGVIVTWILIVFMVCNVVVSAGALMRYSEREKKIAPENPWEEMLDERFDDERMARIYPKAKTVESTERK